MPYRDAYTWTLKTVSCTEQRPDIETDIENKPMDARGWGGRQGELGDWGCHIHTADSTK